jgi:hypothetical protein
MALDRLQEPKVQSDTPVKDRAVNQTDTINQTRRNASISCIEFADFLGLDRRYMVRIELGLEPVPAFMADALSRMISEKAAA